MKNISGISYRQLADFVVKEPIEKVETVFKRFGEEWYIVGALARNAEYAMAEIELNVLMGQCLNRRIDDMTTIRKEVKAWQQSRNNKKAKINWQFRTDDARVKLKKLYPTILS